MRIPVVSRNYEQYYHWLVSKNIPREIGGARYFEHVSSPDQLLGIDRHFPVIVLSFPDNFAEWERMMDMRMMVRLNG